MRERVALAGGTLSVDAGERGTFVKACLPTRPGAYAKQSAAEQAAS